MICAPLYPRCQDGGEAALLALHQGQLTGRGICPVLGGKCSRANCTCATLRPGEACAWCYQHASPGALRRWDEARTRFIYYGHDDKTLRIKGPALRSIEAARAALQEDARRNVSHGP